MKTIVSSRFMANKLSKKNILDIIGRALKQGMTPRKLAITVALGMVMGMLPVLGPTTLICLGLSLVFRLNIPVMQLGNYLVTAPQLLCIIPFMKLGAYLFRLDIFPYSRDQLVELFRNDFWAFLRDSGTAIAGGVGAWLIISIPLFFALYFLCLFFFTRWRFTNPDREGKRNLPLSEL